MHIAYRNVHIEIVELLLDKEIDISRTNKEGLNALHLASSKGHIEIAKLLIEKGIDINLTNYYGRNALHLASSEGHKEIVQLLMNNILSNIIFAIKCSFYFLQ